MDVVRGSGSPSSEYMMAALAWPSTDQGGMKAKPIVTVLGQTIIFPGQEPLDMMGRFKTVQNAQLGDGLMRLQDGQKSRRDADRMAIAGVAATGLPGCDCLVHMLCRSICGEIDRSLCSWALLIFSEKIR